nr:dnaJ homolog subfamily C member 24 isoform X1 [Peromyscus maniculatus bairdii]XP_042131806.1 dnaJ homolog subfamily C member 24 isoform X1 [Peromyscus maniculatus bairdii]
MAFEQTLQKDWYSILGADPSANVSDLKQKYQKLILLGGALGGIQASVLISLIWQNGQLIEEEQESVDRAHHLITTECLGGHQELQYHPDKQSTDVPAGTMDERTQKFIEIDQAWKILGNEETKKMYDLQRHEAELRRMGPVDAQVYLEDMSWNKDDESFSLTCRCGGKYTVSKDEVEEVNLICCDTCSLIVELLHQQ